MERFDKSFFGRRSRHNPERLERLARESAIKREVRDEVVRDSLQQGAELSRRVDKAAEDYKKAARERQEELDRSQETPAIVRNVIDAANELQRAAERRRRELDERGE